jgi:putative nucleotidyltransferase with HDIG domain
MSRHLRHLKYHMALVDKYGRMHMPTRQRRPKDHADSEVRYRRASDTLARTVHHLLTPKLAKRLYLAAEVLLLAGTVVAAAWLSNAEEWSPLLLFGLLLVLALVGEWFTVQLSDGVLSASLVAIVLAMALLGPAPAMACGTAAMILTSSRRRLRPAFWLGNLTAFGVVPFAGGWMILALAGNVHDPHNEHITHGVIFGLIILGVFIVTLGLNLVLNGLDTRVNEGRSLSRQVREFVPLFPGELAAGALATILAVAYMNLGLPVLFGSIVLLLIFQHLTVALLRSEDRADQLEARSIQLASLQFGVLSTLMDALALRDRTTARHAATVARYAKALAVEMDCSEAEQDIVHTAALLHDIGKFTWSDRVLHPERLTDEDWKVIHRHPQDGAALVGKLDGYGPVADAILYHHERMDGGGYPAGLIGSEIPLASRIVAVCSTYDRMTARDSYRSPMTHEDAIGELRKIAGHQLDAELVESFIALLEREGPTFAQDADFETELAFEQHVRKIALPTHG